jgi:hypothetical protein
MKHWIYILLFCFSFSAHPVWAIQFRVLGWTSADENLQAKLTNKPAELTVLTDSLSPVYEFTGAGPLILYKRVEHEGKPTLQNACVVTIPQGMTKGLLILIPGDDTKAVSRNVLPNSYGFISSTAPLIYDYVWLDDSESARPQGMIEFRNMSSVPIALQIDAQQLMLAPKAKAQAPLLPGAKRMNFRAAAQIDSQWKIFRSNPLPTRGPSRMMVILKDGPLARTPEGSGEPNIQMISLFDWPAPAASEPQKVAALNR